MTNEMINQIKEIDEHIKNETLTATHFLMVNVYKKGDTFYDPPTLIIRTSIPHKYLNRYKKIFNDKYIIYTEFSNQYVKAINS